MFNFFKKRNLVTDLSWLGIDIHSHILPGIDDGAKTIEESIAYVKQLQALGFEKLYCTPHIYPELYPNSFNTINPVLVDLQNHLCDHNNNLLKGAAAEYMIDYSFEITSDLLCLPGGYLLIEMSYLSETPNIDQIVFELQVKGYKLILAHPERYNFYHKTPERYQRLKELGCLFQLNVLSVTGYYGKAVKECALSLLKSGLYDLVATDLHHDKHIKLLTTNVQSGELYKTLGSYTFKNKEIFG
jgi:protein-tyrosine phosphatase